MDSVFGFYRLTNKKHYFPTKALVQCMHNAQPECLRVKSTYLQAGGQQMNSVFGFYRVTNMKHFCPARALVQCINYAQPECPHVKAYTLYISA